MTLNLCISSLVPRRSVIGERQGTRLMYITTRYLDSPRRPNLSMAVFTTLSPSSTESENEGTKYSKYTVAHKSSAK